jgi:hypothetical protein
MTNSGPQLLHRESTDLASSPFKSASPHQLFPSQMYEPKTLHVADISYPESYLRTPLPLLPFPNLKWLAGAAYNELENSVEEDEGRDTVRQSIETPGQDNNPASEVWGDGKREWSGWEETRNLKRRCDEDDYNSHQSTTQSPRNKKKPKKSAPGS